MYRKFKDKNIYFISDGDLDGIGARIVFTYFVSTITPFIYFYNTTDRDFPDIEWDVVEDSDYVIFCDTSPSIELYNKIKEKAEVFIFDHHVKSKLELSDLPNYYYDDTICGTKILFNYLSPTRTKLSIIQFVELVNTLDMWDYKHPDFDKARDLNSVMFSYVDWSIHQSVSDTDKYRDFITFQLWKLRNSDEFYLTRKEQERALNAKKQEQAQYKKALKTLVKRVDNSGNQYGWFECDSKLSWVSHRILHENNNLKYVISHSTFVDNLKVSLRTIKEYGLDMSEVATKWGGGAHVPAAGIQFKDEKVFNDLKEGKIHLI